MKLSGMSSKWCLHCNQNNHDKLSRANEIAKKKSTEIVEKRFSRLIMVLKLRIIYRPEWLLKFKATSGGKLKRVHIDNVRKQKPNSNYRRPPSYSR